MKDTQGHDAATSPMPPATAYPISEQSSVDSRTSVLARIALEVTQPITIIRSE
ncbi:hypothetical protein GCM10027568_14900 [Humibacter soli]